jgi:hypothetical protein
VTVAGRIAEVAMISPLKAGLCEPALDRGNCAKIPGVGPGKHFARQRAAGDDGFYIDVTWNITVK